TLTFLEAGEPFGIRVEAGGKLSLNGTNINKVKLTTDKQTTLSGWKGIDNSGTVEANYAEFGFASEAVVCRNNGSFSVEHSLFRECSIAIRVNRDSIQTSKRFKVFSSEFVDNGHAFMLQNATAPLNDLSQIYGNTFTSNTHNFYLGGVNNIQIRNNQITTKNGEHIFEFGQKPENGRPGQYSVNEHVYISFNNFNFIRSEEYANDYFVVKVDYGSPVGIYDCYWNYNGTTLSSITDIKNSNLCNPYSSVAIYRPLSEPVAIGGDTAAPKLVELSPNRSKPGPINLTVVIQDTGWGVDPATVVIKVGNYQATINSYTYNSRHYIFQATVNIPTTGEYDWNVVAQDLAVPGNTMTAHTINGQKLFVTNDNMGQATPPTGWQNFATGIYQLVTLPIKPLEKDHKFVLGLDAPGSTLARWDPATKKYTYYGDSALELFEPGKGFWMRYGSGENFVAS
ncbi:MAG TPA: hypothetical protein VEC37_08820, partial [Bacillota bacterium]|nr:hypothetical protein [Bacillota bacterium]